MQELKIFDRDSALERVDGDAEFFLELIATFKEMYEEARARIDDARERGAVRELEHEAHSIKSSLGNLGGMRAFLTAQRMEDAGRAGSLAKLVEEWAVLRVEVETFLREVEAADLS